MDNSNSTSANQSNQSETVQQSSSDDNVNFYLIGELEPLVGLEPKTIRFYERAGLASPKRHGRLRTYRMKDVERLRAIKYLRQFGVSIAKIKEILALQGDISVDNIGTSKVQNILADHLSGMKEKYRTLNSQIDELAAMIQAPDEMKAD